MPHIAPLLVLLVLGLLTSAAAVVLMARGVLMPPRMTDGKALWVLKRLSPADLGLAFEEISFIVRDERDARRLRLAAWWIPAAAPSADCVLLLHGYADSRVGAIAWAPLWHDLGIHVLAIDLRAHGQSDGEFCGGGTFETADVDQVVDQLRHQRPSQTSRLFLFGASFGAAVALGVAQRRGDIAGVVVDSPYADFKRAAMRQMERLGAPGGWFQWLAVRLAETVVDADFGAVDPVRLIESVECPLLLVQPRNDAAISKADLSRLGEAFDRRTSVRSRDHKWQVEEAGHLMALAADPARYREALSAFLTPLRAAARTGGGESAVKNPITEKR